ncbi:App1 family protein [Dyadobacter chenwenxiniae]|uniref:App1 family protein n=1 Tax=Dyadobacter chenwenxiniae TaxID=2906456 RepID=A0A9X1THN4_9BACT|nr:App1 family protein [Dyadobacter chenwenxiniae]MCF0064975.1 App1 family protein [Dyadobacter chenwenxiniae]UON83095.1 App1 family protein [Dyadobacter chenwenxiniae]
MKRCDIKLYRGYANKKELVVFGHIIKKYPSGDRKYTRTGFRYARTIIELFSVKPIPFLKVVLQVGNITAETTAEEDGYFRFQVPLTEPMPSGWHPYSVTVDDEWNEKRYQGSAQEEFFLPYQSSYGIISDIDDTFLISHSRRSFRKLFVLLSKNVQARKPFDDVVKHYQLLSFASRKHPQKDSNIFFYVSSSEWNLYDMIVRFAELNGLPKAVLKLRTIKSGLDDFVTTGGGSHDHKLRKIHNIINFYPELQFILLGDDSQKDPEIYEEICRQFSANIRAVYIRQTRKRAKALTVTNLKNIQELGIDVCYFVHSNKAIIHSLETGLVFQPPIETLPPIAEIKDLLL